MRRSIYGHFRDILGIFRSFSYQEMSEIGKQNVDIFGPYSWKILYFFQPCRTFLKINLSKKETPHSFKRQQLENKSLFCNLHEFLETFLSYNLTLSLLQRNPRLAEIHDDVSLVTNLMSN